MTDTTAYVREITPTPPDVRTTRDDVTYSLFHLTNGRALMQVADMTGRTSFGGLVNIPSTHAVAMAAALITGTVKSDEKPKSESITDRDIAVTAMCIWEFLLGQFDTNALGEWNNLRERLGTFTMRDACFDVAAWVEKVYAICTKSNPDFGDSHAYDWEVVPDIMDYARDYRGAVSLNPNDFPDPSNVADILMELYAKANPPDIDD